MAIFLKNGKVMVASGGRGLSQDCDCCDKPPPPPYPVCEVCCPGDHEVGDSVLISIECTLPEIAYQKFSPQPTDNGIRIIPAVEISATAAIFVSVVNQLTPILSRINPKCINADRASSYVYSDKTYSEYVGITIGVAHPLYENGRWSPLDPPRCEASVSGLNFFFLIEDWLFTGGSNAIVNIVTELPVGSESYGHSMYAEPIVIFDGQSPCAGVEMSFALLYYAPPYPQIVSQPAMGTEIGVLKILDIE